MLAKFDVYDLALKEPKWITLYIDTEKLDVQGTINWTPEALKEHIEDKIRFPIKDFKILEDRRRNEKSRE